MATAGLAMAVVSALAGRRAGGQRRYSGNLRHAVTNYVGA